MTPANEALAYRIWAFCEPLGWDCTALEIAENVDDSAHRVGAILRWKGWAGRIRRGAYRGVDNPFCHNYRMTFLDSSMDDLNRWSA